MAKGQKLEPEGQKLDDGTQQPEGSIHRTSEDDLSRASDLASQSPKPDLLLPGPEARKTPVGISTPDRAIEEGAGQKTAQPAPPPTRVEVICEGNLGPRLLKKGDRTDDPAYVKLLLTERGRRLVKPVG